MTKISASLYPTEQRFATKAATVITATTTQLALFFVCTTTTAIFPGPHSIFGDAAQASTPSPKFAVPFELLWRAEQGWDIYIYIYMREKKTKQFNVLIRELVYSNNSPIKYTVWLCWRDQECVCCRYYPPRPLAFSCVLCTPAAVRK